MIQHIVAMAISNEPRKSPPQILVESAFMLAKYHYQCESFLRNGDCWCNLWMSWTSSSQCDRRWAEDGIHWDSTANREVWIWHPENYLFWKRCFPWQLLGYCVYVQFQFSVLPRWFSRTLHYGGMHSDFLWSIVVSSFLSFSQLVLCTWHEGAE